MARRTDGKETDEMWTMDNTEGYTQAQLDTINAVLERMMVAGSEDLEVHSINDAITNEWSEGMSEDELYEAVAKRLGLTHPEIADILTNDNFAEAVAADLRGQRHARSDSHSRDKARWLQREDLADDFLAAFDKQQAGA